MRGVIYKKSVVNILMEMTTILLLSILGRELMGWAMGFSIREWMVRM